MPTDGRSPVINELTTHECWRQLRGTTVGRLAVAGRERIEIFPMNYAVDHGTLLFRTDPGSKLQALAENPHAAFEIDGVEPDADVAWSVIVHGSCHLVRGHGHLDTLGVPVYPWQPGDKRRFVRLIPEELTGRQFRITPIALWASPFEGVRRSSVE